ncbi:MAG: PEP-CTERM sorting domain-containing protein [Burkholderiaceae bacterium]|nr:PEP-CTERM sorting domain-containing protein [Burkholderiaceae bacterium]
MKIRRLSAALALALAGLSTTAQAAQAADLPIVIAHRGASAYLPEHTLAGYQLAVQMGADFIEPDLFLTADGVLVARHDRNLNATTNGGAVNVDSLTFAQLQALQARSRGDNVGTAGYAKAGNGYYTAADSFQVPSFSQVLDYVYGLYQADGSIVGIYPEVKIVNGNDAYNLAIADALIGALGDAKYNGFFNGQHGNVILQSFSETVVRHLSLAANNPFNLPVAYLVTNCQTAAANAATIAGIADGVGTSIASMDAACVGTLKAAGLKVHAYTLTTDALMAPRSYDTILGYGVDGIFTNNPDLGVAAVAALAPVPEPASLALMCGGLLGLGAWVRRRSAA